jgi:ubiquinone/menaquinone biosynthesis C-methylase UbiE
MSYHRAKTYGTRTGYRHRFTDLTDALIPVYNWGFKVFGGRKHDAFRQRVIELAGLRGEEHVLDAGCGTGLTALRIAEQYPACRVCGVDLSARMIEVAQKEALRRGLNVDLQTGSLTDLPYADGLFHVVLTNIMFHHLDIAEKRQAIAEIARVLRSPAHPACPEVRRAERARGEHAEGRAGGIYVSAEFGARAHNWLERHLAKGEFTLYPSHLTEAGLTILHEELGSFAWGLPVCFRVAVKMDHATPELSEEERS